MRSVKHRSIKRYAPVASPGAFVSPLIGPYHVRQNGGWTQEYESEDGGYISVNGTQRQLTDSAERQMSQLLSSLDALMPHMFAVIDAQPPPFDGFDIDQLEIEGIHLTDDRIVVSFLSEQLNAHDVTADVEVVGSEVHFRDWCS